MDFAFPFLEKIAADIDPEEEKRLVLQYQQGETEAERKSAYKKLRRAYQPMINSLVSQAKASSTNVPETILHMRAESEFPAALKIYDPARGAALGTHVYGRLHERFKNAIGENQAGPYVPRDNQKGANELSQAMREAQRTYNTANPTDDQILEFYPGRTKEDIEKYKKYLFQDFIGDKPMDVDSEGSPVTLKDQHTGESVLEDPEDEYRIMELERLDNLMKQELSPQDYEIVKAYRVDNKPMAQIALSHGMSTTKLRRILGDWDRIYKEKGQ